MLCTTFFCIHRNNNVFLSCFEKMLPTKIPLQSICPSFFRIEVTVRSVTMPRLIINIVSFLFPGKKKKLNSFPSRKPPMWNSKNFDSTSQTIRCSVPTRDSRLEFLSIQVSEYFCFN